MKYKYYLSAIKCNRILCDLGITDFGIKIQISFITTKEPTKKNIKKIEKLLESTKNEKKLKSYYINVKFIRAEVVVKDVN